MPATSQSESVSGIKPSEGSLVLHRYWFSVAIATGIVLLVAAIRWSLAHPFGIHWDESGYLDEALIDAQRLRGGMLLKFAGRLVLKTAGRPPAYRFLADPLLALVGSSTTIARTASLICSTLTGWFIFRCVRLVGSRSAAAIAVLIFILSPEIIAASIFLSTDAPLYLATSALLYYLIRSSNEPLEKSRAWLGLGLAVSLGFLSKASFFVIGPLTLFWWCVTATGRRAIRESPSFLLKAAAVPLILAVPWWAVNFKSALEYGKYARGFVRSSLGSPSPGTFLRWLNTVWQCLLGHGVTIFVVALLIAFLSTTSARKLASRTWSSEQRISLSLCAFSGIPIVLTQLTGTNHLLRHISPAMVPLAIAVGLIADKTFVTRSKLWSPALSIPMILQLAMIAYPVLHPNTVPVGVGFVNANLPWRAMSRFDQWNWEPIWQISRGCGVASPTIGYLGGGREFTPPAIQYPWVKNVYSTRLSTFGFPDVSWLWRYEDGPINWNRFEETVSSKDIVITAPGYAGDPANGDVLDNQHNTELADRLSTDRHFKSPVHLILGRFEPVRVDVFVNRNLACDPQSFVTRTP